MDDGTSTGLTVVVRSQSIVGARHLPAGAARRRYDLVKATDSVHRGSLQARVAAADTQLEYQ